MRFFKMPNKIFSYQLSPKSMFVYAYLISRMNALHAAVVSYDTISCNCHMDRKTAAQAVKELLQQQLISKETRRNYRGNLKNKYMVNMLPGRWFKVDYQVFQTQIGSTDFMVYCFVKKCMSVQGEAFPSLNTIAKDTGISHSRIVQSVKYLRRYTFINRVRRHYRRTKAYRHSRYILFRFKDKKKKARSVKRVFRKLTIRCNANHSSSNAIVKRERKNVKLFFACRGSPYFPQLLSIPTSLTIKEKIALYFK
ncbi:MAG TPA: helix-turn-helix domain-containing protein [Caproicibacter sp.]|nr:helix-turn-helix domain-containing protein [Caproicibacter sp.]